MFIKKLLKSIKMMFKPRCPECGGIMDWEMIDMHSTRMFTNVVIAERNGYERNLETC